MIPALPGPLPGALTEQYLTVAEVADRLRVSKMTVYRLVRSGELPCRKFGRSFRVPASGAEEFLRNTLITGS